MHPLPLDRATLGFYWPVMIAALLVVMLLLWRGRISRAAGALLLLGYVLYAAAATLV